MNPWTDKLAALKGRKPALPGLRSGVSLNSADYSGPADGDFARYVDELLANAELQRRLQTRAAPAARAPSAASAQRGNARDNAAQARRQTERPAAAAKAAPRAAAQAAKALPKFTLVTIALWVMAIAATIFFPGLAIWFVAAIVINSVVKGVRRGLGKS